MFVASVESDIIGSDSTSSILMKIMSGNCIRIGESDPFDFGSVHVCTVLPEFQLCIVTSSFILLYVCTY